MAEAWTTPKTWSYKEAPGSDSLNEQIRDNLKYVKESLPAGIMLGYGGAAAPAQWLLCDGTAVSRTTYSALFAAIGVLYGVGNGSTTFNLPDYRGRVMVGLNSTDADFDTLGEKYGSKTHTLTSAQMPVHTHIQNAHTHTQNAHTHTQNAHTHTQNAHNHSTSYQTDGENSPLGGNYNIVTDYRDPTGAGNKITIGNTTPTNQNTTPTNQNTTPTNQNTTPTNQNTGSGSAHNNVQPGQVSNFIIKY